MGRKQKKKETGRSFEQELTGVVICFIAVFVGMGILIDDSMGRIGNAIVDFLFGMFGITNFLLPVLLFILGINLIMKNRENRFRAFKFALTIMVCVSFLSFLVVYDKEEITYMTNAGLGCFKTIYIDGVQGVAGGVLGGLAIPFVMFFGKIGTYIIFLCIALIMIFKITGIHPAAIVAFILRKARRVRDKRTLHRNIAKEVEKDIPEPKKRHEVAEKVPFEKFDLANQIGIDETGKEVVNESRQDNEEQASPVEKEEVKSAETEKIPTFNIETSTPEPENYVLPPIDLLQKHKGASADKYKKELIATAEKLQSTLDSFGVSAKVINVSRGPAVTRYELAPDPGVKVSKIVNLTDDIALNLAAPSIRMEAPIPGKSAVGIEIPNSSIDAVYFRDVVESNEFEDAKSKISFGLGKDTSGTTMIADIGKMPHVLIAGATGSGKSVCINTIITSILYKAKPSEVKLIMIDPKVVELGVYNGIPHLLIPVVTDPKKAAGALNWAVQEMVNRYNLFAAKGVRDMKGYNEALEADGEEGKLPQIVIIIDELADLMMVAPNDVEDAICRLAQMARAAGMHLVIATQRPSVDVITGLIKANVPSRIAFAVSSQVDSRTILDMAGAEKLLGKGDMLFAPVGASKPTRVQGAFVTDKEVEAVVKFIKANSEVKYDEDVLEKIQNGVEGAKPQTEEEDDVDPLLNEVISLVVEIGQASTSLIQRRFKVGYARAARIIDQMEARGIVSGFEGTKPRQVLISKEEWEELQAMG
ncbi:MAG: DNA translocase FtsK [Clostridiales bacterium]|nr:DNA translocase FtsK [Clostridiales bacterium]